MPETIFGYGIVPYAVAAIVVLIALCTAKLLRFVCGDPDISRRGIIAVAVCEGAGLIALPVGLGVVFNGIAGTPLMGHLAASLTLLGAAAVIYSLIALALLALDIKLRRRAVRDTEW